MSHSLIDGGAHVAECGSHASCDCGNTAYFDCANSDTVLRQEGGCFMGDICVKLQELSIPEDISHISLLRLKNTQIIHVAHRDAWVGFSLAERDYI